MNTRYADGCSECERDGGCECMVYGFSYWANSFNMADDK